MRKGNRMSSGHSIQANPLYKKLTPEQAASIDADAKSIARQEAFNGGVRWGLLAFIVVMVVVSAVL